eukprot:4042181-Prymnesium_polylepis.1
MSRLDAWFIHALIFRLSVVDWTASGIYIFGYPEWGLVERCKGMTLGYGGRGPGRTPPSPGGLSPASASDAPGGD